ncbi:MAG: Na+/H+ antiporter NhaA [Bacteroidetes bacterium]|nr:Na+/H+ antiporter NhaA [Bacteroidota bacterium]
MASANRPLERLPLVKPIQDFIRLESSGGILLLACAVIAIVWANSPAAGSYFDLWGSIMTVGLGDYVLSKPLLLWINDGLMAIFFFVVGLEIKREFLIGELSSAKKASLALAAAVGGMIVPAAIYAIMNLGGSGSDGWGIPMATDIAFALGVLALLGKRAPLALKVFLTALAIVDDLGAVLVIAIFYTAKIKMGFLLFGAATLVVLAIGNRLGIRRTSFYVVLGVVLWVAFLKSGVHATVAGVLLALTVPARRLIDASEFLDRGRSLMDRFSLNMREGMARPSSDQVNTLHALEDAVEKLDTPAYRMEHALHGWVAYFIMPVFALANAGVALGGGVNFGSPVTLGIIAGLFLGKQIGVTLFAWLSVKLGIAELPQGVAWRQVYGVSLLCGIGFTMSLFIANLAFSEAALLDEAKIGILAASVVSGIAGWIALSRTAGAGSQTNEAAA